MRYRNLDLDAHGYVAMDGAERFRVRVADSPQGGQKFAEAEEVSLPGDLRKRIRQLDERLLRRSDMIRLGEDLGAVLFPPRARRLLDLSRARLRDDEALRIRLRLDSYALADLPWEYVYLPREDTPAGQKGPEGFLVLDRRVSLVRSEVEVPPGALDPVGSGPLRLVALLANPTESGYAMLNLETEESNIRAALEDVPDIQPEFYPDATAQTLLDALGRAAHAHVFHFAGHGQFVGDLGQVYGSVEGAGVIVLLGERRRAVPLKAEKLALSLAARGVRLAVLSACEGGRRDGHNAWTGVAPALTRTGIPAVVAMQYSIRDDNAIAFSRQFYRSLASGHSIDAAVTDGRLAIFVNPDADEDERDWGVPVLYLCAEEGVLFPRPLPETGPAMIVKEERIPPPQPELSDYLRDRLRYLDHFVTRRPQERGPQRRTLERMEFESVEALKEELPSLDLEDPRLITVRGTLAPCLLLYIGWWERQTKGEATRFTGRNRLQEWLFHGFEQWGPSWALHPSAEAGPLPYLLGQLASGDEADSLTIIVRGEKGRKVRQDHFDERGWGVFEAEVTGLLVHRKERDIPGLEAVQAWGKEFDYCIDVDEYTKTHQVSALPEKTETYSGYLWQCVAPREWLQDINKPHLDEVYFIWEHTDFTKEEAVQYNLESLQHKYAYLEARHGELILLQKSSPVVPGDPVLSTEKFIRSILQAGQNDQ